MSKHVILSSAYFPPVCYFSAIAQAEKVIVDLNECYQKQSYRSRTVILSANGPLSLIVPVKKVVPFTTSISEVRIDYKMPWQRNHWRALTAAYNNSPYFLYYQDYISGFFEDKPELLVDFNSNILKVLLKILKINTPIEFSRLQTIEEMGDMIDFRQKIHPKREAPIVTPPYSQVFQDKFGFIEQMSILDLLFNEGPMASRYL